MSLPNIPCQTLGGKYFWETLETHKGWNLQMNKVTHHFRIIDPANIRQSWSMDEQQIWNAFLSLTNQDSTQEPIQNVIEHRPLT